MKRTFIAFDIEPSDTLKEVFETIRKNLHSERIRWADTDQLHITLKFLGDTEESLIPSINNALSGLVKKYDPFNVRLKGIGVFRNIHNPQVLWMGCHVEDQTVRLKQELESLMKQLGYEEEKRAFSPHLTLGRIKFLRDNRHLSGILSTYRDNVFQEITVTELKYYESKLTSSGSIYTPIKTFRVDPVQS